MPPKNYLRMETIPKQTVFDYLNDPDIKSIDFIISKENFVEKSTNYAVNAQRKAVEVRSANNNIYGKYDGLLFLSQEQFHQMKGTEISRNEYQRILQERFGNFYDKAAGEDGVMTVEEMVKYRNQLANERLDKIIGDVDNKATQ